MKIIDAVKLAGRFLRGEITPEQVRPDPNGPMIGVSHPRPSAMIKACGLAEFSADIKLQDALGDGRGPKHRASCENQIRSTPRRLKRCPASSAS